MKIGVGVSARHVHLTKQTLETLFGEGYSLTKKKDLTQPLQFAAEEMVTIETPKSKIERVRILGPIRPYDQVEISKTDAVKLGVNPPVRNSGKVEASESITLIGPKGKVFLEEGCIIPTRHIHITKKQREEYGLEVDMVSVRIPGEKGGILDSVYIKESEEAFFELHLDTDDANAHLLVQGSVVEIMGE